MNDGWIKVNRSIQEHWLWNEFPFSYGQAWIDLILLANWEDKKIPYKGKVVICKRGDVNLSISSLADRWKWGREKTRRFLALLETDGMVKVNATTHRTTITLVNYDFYQIQPTTNSATNRQQIEQPVDTTKKEKKEKNKEKIYKKENLKFKDMIHTDYDFDEIETRLLDDT